MSFVPLTTCSTALSHKWKLLDIVLPTPTPPTLSPSLHGNPASAMSPSMWTPRGAMRATAHFLLTPGDRDHGRFVTNFLRACMNSLPSNSLTTKGWSVNALMIFTVYYFRVQRTNHRDDSQTTLCFRRQHYGQMDTLILFFNNMFDNNKAQIWKM